MVHELCMNYIYIVHELFMNSQVHELKFEPHQLHELGHFMFMDSS